MTWHWSYKLLPELAGLPDAEKARVWERCQFRWWRSPVVWLAVAVHMVVLYFAIRLLAGRAGVLFGPRSWAGWFVVGPLGGGAFGRGLGTLVRQAGLHAARPYLARELPGRCRGCGYDLTGNAPGVRPCGRGMMP